MPAATARSRLACKRRRRGEIDEHVAMVLVEREARVLGDGRGDRLAHAAVGRDEADADRLVGGAHAPPSWRKAERRAIAAALRGNYCGR